MRLATLVGVGLVLACSAQAQNAAEALNGHIARGVHEAIPTCTGDPDRCIGAFKMAFKAGADGRMTVEYSFWRGAKAYASLLNGTDYPASPDAAGQAPVTLIADTVSFTDRNREYEMKLSGKSLTGTLYNGNNGARLPIHLKLD